MRVQEKSLLMTDAWETQSQTNSVDLLLQIPDAHQDMKKENTLTHAEWRLDTVSIHWSVLSNA